MAFNCGEEYGATAVSLELKRSEHTGSEKHYAHIYEEHDCAKGIYVP